MLHLLRCQSAYIITETARSTVYVLFIKMLFEIEQTGMAYIQEISLSSKY